MNWYLTILRKFAVFGGRSGRKEYWIAGVIHTLIISVVWLLKMAPSTLQQLFDSSWWPDRIVGESYRIGSTTIELYILVMAIPILAVTTRRLHDTGRSGSWQLFPVLALCIPFLGRQVGIAFFSSGFALAFLLLVPSIVLLIFVAQAGTAGDNKYGAVPDESSRHQQPMSDRWIDWYRNYLLVAVLSASISFASSVLPIFDWIVYGYLRTPVFTLISFGLSTIGLLLFIFAIYSLKSLNDKRVRILHIIINGAGIVAFLLYLTFLASRLGFISPLFLTPLHYLLQVPTISFGALLNPWAYIANPDSFSNVSALRWGVSLGTLALNATWCYFWVRYGKSLSSP